MTLVLAVLSGSSRSLLIGNPDWNLRTGVLILVGLLLVGAVVLSAVARWRKGQKPLSPSADQELAQYREMYERGEITRSEYQRLKGVLGTRIRARLGQVPHPEVTPAPRQEPPAAGGGSNDIRPA